MNLNTCKFLNMDILLRVIVYRRNFIICNFYYIYIYKKRAKKKEVLSRGRISLSSRLGGLQVFWHPMWGPIRDLWPCECESRMLFWWSWSFTRLSPEQGSPHPTAISCLQTHLSWPSSLPLFWTWPLVTSQRLSLAICPPGGIPTSQDHFRGLSSLGREQL